ncbi:LORF2 protein, partial [Crocuta crocuta]
GWFNIGKSINWSYCINRMNDKIHISIDAEKAFCKIQHPFIIKISNHLETEEICLNIIKATYKNPTVNIVLDGELKAFPLKSGIRHICSLSVTLFNIVPEVLARAPSQDKRKKDIQVRKEEVK